MNEVQGFRINESGRDFVVGDIHGCFDQVSDALDARDFNTTRDRLFSVGDLVDRGTQSEEAIDWIAKPWFHAVRGNHEQMAIGVAAGRHDRANYLQNGGEWFAKLSDSRQRMYAEAFDRLPYAIEVDTPHGLIGIVHAECGGVTWPEFCDALQNPASKTKLRNVTETALWARTRIKNLDASPVAGLAWLYVGHTPVDEVCRLGNVIYIDTGAVYGRGLTMVEI